MAAKNNGSAVSRKKRVEVCVTVLARVATQLSKLAETVRTHHGNSLN